MEQRIRTHLALLNSIIDKSKELHGEHADPVIMLVDIDGVVHYEIYPIEETVDAPITPTVTAMQFIDLNGTE